MRNYFCYLIVTCSGITVSTDGTLVLVSLVLFSFPSCIHFKMGVCVHVHKAIKIIVYFKRSWTIAHSDWYCALCKSGYTCKVVVFIFHVIYIHSAV